ncbi:unnamed protein product [Phytophthora lilii]|uniref:Unnamed protein product n=1 Tax=Phytophthora lilii TaxID=2077276 RepID=A0A9W6WNV4_9STRA|nr:unnamed protein product [Phytophthora lilii]
MTAAFQAEQDRSHTDSRYREGSAGPSFPPSLPHGAPSRDDDAGGRRRFENTRSVPPSQVLMVRMLPPDIEEGEVRAGLANWKMLAYHLPDVTMINVCSSKLLSRNLMVSKISG